MVNVDRHIAILAGLVAGPAFGVAMMAAPEYLHLEPMVATVAFWGGIAVFVLTIFAVGIISLHEKRKRKTVLGPILAMAFGALIFCGGAAWYLWPKTDPQFHRDFESYSRIFSSYDQEKLQWVRTIATSKEQIFDIPKPIAERLKSDMVTKQDAWGNTIGLNEVGKREEAIKAWVKAHPN